MEFKLEIHSKQRREILKSTNIRILLYATIILVIFLGGYYTGKITSSETTREITIGYENQEHPNRLYKNY